MTAIGSNNSYSVDLSQVKKLDVSGGNVRKATEEEVARFKKIQELAYTRPVNLQDHVSQKVYAEVKVGNKTVATLYNGGTSMTSNQLAGKLQGLPSMGESETATGPELAQKRAEEIAKALGGTIVKSSTAVTQAQYAAAPPIQFKVDYAAMEQDRKDAEARAASSKTKVNTQIISQTPEGEKAQTISDGDAVGKSAKEEFLEFTAMSWEEKVRAMILKSLGLEEEDLKQMSAEDRDKIEAKIKAKIDEEIEKKTGIHVAADAA